MLYTNRHTTISLFALLSLVLLFSACNPEAKYATKGVNLFIQTDSAMVSASKVEVEISPERDVYYYCNIIPDSAFNNQGLDYRFMQYVLDSVYSNYLAWRRALLHESSPYIASFSSHCLSYGNDRREFSNLQPNTDYIVYAFCVNPETNKPMGQLFKLNVHTDSVAYSSLTFTYSIERKDDGVWLTIEPSNDEETYIYEMVKKEYVEHFNSPYIYMLELLELYEGFNDHSNTMGLIHRGYEYLNLSGYLEEGESYYFIVVGYDGGPSTPIGYVTFTFEPLDSDILHANFNYSD